MIPVQIRYEGNEAIMTLPQEIIEKLNQTMGTNLHLEITSEGIKAYPPHYLLTKYLCHRLTLDEERKDLDKIAILSSK